MRKIALAFIAFLPFLSFAQWSTIGGNPTFEQSYPFTYGFALNTAGRPYVTFSDFGNTYVTTVKKLGNAGFWETVGGVDFVQSTTAIALAIHPLENQPWIAVSDQDQNGKITVKKFDGAAWVTVGTPGFGPESAGNLSLCFTANGIAHISFIDYYNSNEISVLRFLGSWVYAGAPGIGNGSRVSIVSDTDSSIAIAFRDQDQNSKLTVKRFNGNWLNAGAPGISNGEAQSFDIAASAAGALFVAYTDYSESEKISVQKFETGAWSFAGTPAFSTSFANGINIDVARDGTPYVSWLSGLPKVSKFKNGEWTQVGGNLNNALAYYNNVICDTLSNPLAFVGLQPAGIYRPFVFKYDRCSDSDYGLSATLTIDSAITVYGASTTVTIAATGGVAPYFGVGAGIVTPGGYNLFSVTDANGCSFLIDTIIPEPNPPCTVNMWEGDISSDWNNPANWSCGIVPNDSSEVYIFGGGPFLPTINSVVTCRTFYVEGDIVITIGPAGKLNITGGDP